MKRCSQCEFIYEDDQSVCDMDGHSLVHEPTLQALEVIASRAAGRLPAHSTKSRAARPALMAGASLLIGTVLSVGFFGFTGAYTPENTSVPSIDVIPAPLSAPDQTPVTPVVSPSPSPVQSPPAEKAPVRPTTSPSIANVAPRSRSTTHRQVTARSQPSNANQKKEKGIGGFFKKTGRILKKPFKF